MYSELEELFDRGFDYVYTLVPETSENLCRYAKRMHTRHFSDFPACYALTDSPRSMQPPCCVHALRNRFNMAGLSRVMGGRLGSLGRSLRNTQLLLQSRILIYITAWAHCSTQSAENLYVGVHVGNCLA